MQAPRPLLAALSPLLAALALGCASTPTPTPAPAPTPTPTPGPEPTPEPAPTHIRAPFITLLRDGAILTALPGQPPRDTGLRPGSECADTMGIGSSSPVVSPDGRFIAFNDGRDAATNTGELVVAALSAEGPSPRPETLTHHKGGLDVCVQVTGWSVDGRRLLFHVGEAGFEDATPPAGLVTGFFLWERDAGPARHLPWLDSADLFSPDGGSVLRLVDLPEPSRGRALHRVNLADGASTRLVGREDPYAFGQLHVVEDLVAFIGATTVEFAPLADPSAATVVASRPFAEAQWPRLSPDRKHLAWQRILREKGVPRPALVVSPIGRDSKPESKKDIELGPLAGSARIEVEWFDAMRLLVCDGGGVRLVDLTGTAETIAGPGACFIPRGSR